MYTIVPKERKNYLKNNPILFFLLTLGSILPDIDIFFGGHRNSTHSLFLPLIFFILSHFLTSKNKDLRFILFFFSLIWFSHLIFDLTFGPMALLWPIDNRFYDAQMGVIFDLEGNFLLPITIKGFFVKVFSSDPSTGSTVFFVNWSIEERTTHFGGNTLNWPITNFTTQVVIFLWYIYFVVYPVSKLIFELIIEKIFSTRNEFKELGSHRRLQYLFLRMKQIVHNENIGISMVLILMIFLSLYAGPLQGNTWEDRKEYREPFWSITETTRIIATRTINNPYNSRLVVDAVIDKSTLPFQFFVLKTTIEYASEIMENVSGLINLHLSGNITQIELFQTYFSVLKSKEFDYKTINTDNNATWDFTSEQEIILLYDMYNWNLSYSFSKQLTIYTKLIIDRTLQVRYGYNSALFFSVLFIGILFHAFRKKAI